jgi:acyl-CoA reductase-like NAD-dependent aldehyde dehydrogenase
MMVLQDHWINGSWSPGSGSKRLPVIDPTSEETIAELVAAGPEHVDRAVEAANRALPGWSATDLSVRAALLRQMAEGLERRVEEFAQLLAREIGCPLWFSRALQVPMPVQNLRATADALDTMQLEEAAGTSAIWKEPIGVVAAITPWNAP